jgi:hypothetical protein
LYGLARYLLRDESEALLVTVVWAVSPAVLRTAVEARQDDLLGVLAILFIWLLAVCLEEKVCNHESICPRFYLVSCLNCKKL